MGSNFRDVAGSAAATVSETYIRSPRKGTHVMPEQYIKVVTESDNVATLLRDAEEGETLDIAVDDDVVTVTLNDDIEFGHKVALNDIAEGDTIVKYGKSIGYASKDIAAGDWVHVHNVDSNYGRGDLAAEEGESAEAVHE
jgi:altronate dehydratase small subunit